MGETTTCGHEQDTTTHRLIQSSHLPIVMLSMEEVPLLLQFSSYPKPSSSLRHRKMQFSAAIGSPYSSVSRIAFLSHLLATDVSATKTPPLTWNYSTTNFFICRSSLTPKKPSPSIPAPKVSTSDDTSKTQLLDLIDEDDDVVRQARVCFYSLSTSIFLLVYCFHHLTQYHLTHYT